MEAQRTPSADEHRLDYRDSRSRATSSSTTECVQVRATLSSGNQDSPPPSPHHAGKRFTGIILEPGEYGTCTVRNRHAPNSHAARSRSSRTRCRTSDACLQLHRHAAPIGRVRALGRRRAGASNREDVHRPGTWHVRSAGDPAEPQPPHLRPVRRGPSRRLSAIRRGPVAIPEATIAVQPGDAVSCTFQNVEGRGPGPAGPAGPTGSASPRGSARHHHHRIRRARRHRPRLRPPPSSKS